MTDQQNPNRSRLALWVLWFAGLQLLAFGLWALIAPTQMMALVEISLPTKNAETEIRAFYGGLEIGLGALMCFAGWYGRWQKAGLILQAVSFLSIALGRVFGMLLAQSHSNFLIFASLTEFVLVALAIWAFRSLPD